MRAFVLTILLIGLAFPVAAQETPADDPEAAEETVGGEETVEGEEGAVDETAIVSQAAYDDSLNRLGEISGALFHLDALCRPGRQDIWRSHIEDFLAAQRLGDVRTGRLVASFNVGYRDYATNHVACTPAAQELSRRFAKEGIAISSDLAARYGD